MGPGTRRKVLLAGLAVAVLASARAWGAVDITLRGQFFSPAEKAFREIYGSGWRAGGEIGVRLSWRLDLWLSGDYFTGSGKLTFTQEETKLSLMPLGAGLRYRVTTGGMSIYLGAGAVIVRFRESNPIGTVAHTGPGAVARAGLLLRVVRGFLLHLETGYSYVPMKPADFNIDVGGLEAGAGLAVEF